MYDYGASTLARSLTRAQRQSANEWTAAYFAIAMLGLITIFTISHWASFISYKYLLSSKAPLIKGSVSMIRSVRGTMLHKVPLYPSLGHATVFTIYLLINLTLCLYDLDPTSLFSFAKRSGWMAAYNIALVTFLALKNTPLAFLTAYSYERLNILHQLAGYCTIIFTLLHTVVFTTALSYEDALIVLLEDANIMGIVAGCSMLCILATALTLRNWAYELFYVAHVSLVMLVLIAAGMHRPDLALKTVFIIIFAAAIWVFDRIISFVRILWRASGARACVTPFPRGGTRITVRGVLGRARPGTHVFLWIPGVRLAETHPFTVVATDPLELVVVAHNGFTKDLFSYASKNPSAILRAFVNGPYGTLPDFASFDQIILVAGGSGASFTFGVAVDLVKKLENAVMKPFVRFLWVVRHLENLTWYTKELEILQASPMIHLIIHVTHSSSTTSTATPLQTTSTASTKDEKDTSSNFYIGEQPAHSDIERTGDTRLQRPTSHFRGLCVHAGRPDVSTLVPNMLENMESHERTVVAVCGPKSLMLNTRLVVASLVRAGKWSISLYCEQFGW